VAEVARVAVNPEVIRWALQRTDKAEMMEKKFPKLMSWLNNETQPTFKQLEQFAKATSTPLGFFFLSKPPQIQFPIPHYRTIDDHYVFKPSPDLLETVHMMQRRQAWMRDYLLDMGQEPLSYVGSCQLTDHPKDVAQKIRRALEIENGWAADCRNWQEALQMLLTKIENIGILVVRNGIVGNNTHRKLDVNEFRGFVLVDEYAPLIFINGADGKAAQMFTIAHELAHIWFGASAAFDLSNLQPSDHEMEQVCNQTATEFLVPEDELGLVWKDIHNAADRFNLLARHFKVSSIVTARRALDLMFISRDEFFDFYHEWMELERKQAQDGEAGGDFYLNQHFRIGRRFAEAVFTSVKEGRLQYNEAYRLTGLNGGTFAKYAKHLGIEVYS
jgi:Zn-dependent peptidase ImmA (M78 family)